MNALRPLVPLAALLLAGCTSLIAPRGDSAVFLLPAPPAATAPGAAPLAVSLAVAMPDAAGLLDSRALLISPHPDQVQVYAGARWAERPGAMLRQRLLTALAAQGLARAVPADSGALTRCTLESDLDDFRARVEGGHASVRVVLQLRLIDNASRALLAQRRFEAEAPAAGTRAGDVVEAFGSASAQVVEAAATWTARHLRTQASGTR